MWKRKENRTGMLEEFRYNETELDRIEHEWNNLTGILTCEESKS